MTQVKRIDATQARNKVLAGDAVLVCAYEDEGKCRQLRLDGAMTLAELQATESRRSKDDAIIFYCA
jgi:hypothetical protein